MSPGFPKDMRNAATAIVGLFIFCLAILPYPAASETQSLSGFWYTENEENGMYAQIIYDRTSDGTFSARMRQIENCHPVKEWIEQGTWEYTDGAIRQVTEFVSESATDYHDVYEVVSQDHDAVKIHDTETGIDWTWTRVTAGFKFPPPNNCPVS